MIKQLIEVLTQVGKPSVKWTSPDGSTLLILPYGGRILGLFAPDSDRNFFWTHPALDSVDTAKAFYASNTWHNSGGDRTWLAPEIDFFFPKYPNLAVYTQPADLDPGNYELTYDDNSIVLKNRFFSQLSRSKATAELEITKRLASTPNPLRGIHNQYSSDIKYAGYTLQTKLEIRSCDAAFGPVGLWNLLQLPHEGEFLIPTTSKSTVTTCFGNVEASDLTVLENLVRYRMHASGEQKIGLPPLNLVGRMGYVFSSSDGAASLIVRNFSLNRLGDYVDVPRNELDGQGAAIQACNINSSLGAFSEMEHHAPAIGGSTGLLQCEDSSQVWAFSGPAESISAIARALVSFDA
jgi:hypothetical protein